MRALSGRTWTSFLTRLLSARCELALAALQLFMMCNGWFCVR